MDIEEIMRLLRTELFLVKPLLSREIAAKDHFKNKWGLDSLDLVEFVARIEQRFNLLIPDKDLEKFISLEEVAHYVNERLTVKA